jgi:hypothetical protein
MRGGKRMHNCGFPIIKGGRSAPCKHSVGSARAFCLEHETMGQALHDWLSQTISGLEVDEGWVRLADVLAAIPQTGDDSLWLKGSEWQRLHAIEQRAQEAILSGNKVARYILEGPFE